MIWMSRLILIMRISLRKIRVPKSIWQLQKRKKVYTEAAYEPDCYIMFGKESAGIPEEILVDHEDTCVRIPMMGQIRSLNLGNSVAVVLYEALRQNGFAKWSWKESFMN